MGFQGSGFRLGEIPMGFEKTPKSQNVDFDRSKSGERGAAGQRESYRVGNYLGGGPSVKKLPRGELCGP